MNDLHRKSKRGPRWFAGGQAAAELGGALLVLVPLLLAAADFGRLYYTYVTLQDAARAGAQYGSQSVTNAADTAGIKAAATADASNISGMTASASQCTCATGSTVTSCPTSYCTSAPPDATFVTVNTSATFGTIVNYPGIPSSVPLTGQAVMMVEQ
jgi:Flp pilus assembly protein TadG